MKRNLLFANISILAAVGVLVSCKTLERPHGFQPGRNLGMVTNDVIGKQYLNAPYMGADVSKAKILEELEGYTTENFIGGIPYADGSAYAIYSQRALGSIFKNELLNFGWGDQYVDFKGGQLNGVDRPAYWHGWQNKLPAPLNAWNNMDETTSKLFAYLVSNYYMPIPDDYQNPTEPKWTPSLASDYPLAKDSDGNWLPFDESKLNDTNLYKVWRIPVKKDITYSSLSPYFNDANNRKVKLEDYLTPFKTMLIGNNGQARGSDLTVPSSGGIDGAESFMSATGNLDQIDDAEKIDQLWESSGVGAKVLDENGQWYVELSFLSPCNVFYALYRASNSTYSPLPVEFLKYLRDNADPAVRNDPAAKRYGQNRESIVSTGPFTMEDWQQDKELVFKRNGNYTGPDASHITLPGYVFTVLKDQNRAWEELNAGHLDLSGIPATYVKDNKQRGDARKISASSIWKLQSNALTPNKWEELFGKNGTVFPHAQQIDWNSNNEVPGMHEGFIPKNRYIMSNPDFLRGVFWSLDRKTLAEDQGREPASWFLPDAYMIEPVDGVSWRSTEEGKNVIRRIEGQNAFDDNGNYKKGYAYNTVAATNLFKRAADNLKSQGHYKEGDTITLSMWWQNEEQFKNEGSPISKYIIDAWNKANTGISLAISLKANNADWMDAYYVAQRAECDFAFGSINGNQYDPLSFMDTVSTTNRSAFTLSWGVDTTQYGGLETKDPYNDDGSVKLEKGIWFDGQQWSYDGLYQAATYGTVINHDGSVANLFVAAITDIKKDAKNYIIEVTYAYLDGVAGVTAGLDESKPIEVTNRYDGAPIDSASIGTPSQEVQPDGTIKGKVIITIPIAAFPDSLYINVKVPYSAKFATTEFGDIDLGKEVTAAGGYEK